MKNIAIAYSEFVIGGTTTSLIFLLDSLDYSKAAVDLYTYDDSGILHQKINPNVNQFTVGKKIKKTRILLWALITGKLFVLFAKTVFKANFSRRFRMGISQIGGVYRAKNTAVPAKQYDLAIGYMEFWADEYAVRLKATQKISMIHQNYNNAFFQYFLDKALFARTDKIAFVSEANCESFKQTFKHQYDEKVLFMPNLLNAQTVLAMSNETTPPELRFPGFCVLITSARIDRYVKGLDRMVDVARVLKARSFPFKWLIIGGGGEEEDLRRDIIENGLGDSILILGQQANPYKFIKICDYFVLLSRREGKPMCIDEARILGKPCIVTSYDSAVEQIGDQDDCHIVSNEEFNPSLVADIIVDSYQGRGDLQSESGFSHENSNVIKNEQIIRDIIYGHE